MWRFDARIVTYRFPAQSVRASIALLVKQFCNLDPSVPHPLDFLTTAVQAGMPAIPAFDVVNQRPSTVMRTLWPPWGAASISTGFTVHAWAGSAERTGADESATVDGGPADAEIVPRDDVMPRSCGGGCLWKGGGRRRWSGIRTCAPGEPPYGTDLIGIGLDRCLDVLRRPRTHLARIGTQWIRTSGHVVVRVGAANPPQESARRVFTVAAGWRIST